MTSPESQNKKGISMLSLMKEDLKHRKWMLIVSSVVQAFAGPIVILFMLSALRRSRQYGISDFVTDTDYMYKTVHSLVDNITGEYLPIMQIVVAVVGAIIVGIGGYRHLFNRRMKFASRKKRKAVCCYISEWSAYLVRSFHTVTDPFDNNVCNGDSALGLWQSDHRTRSRNSIRQYSVLPCYLQSDHTRSSTSRNDIQCTIEYPVYRI